MKLGVLSFVAALLAAPLAAQAADSPDRFAVTLRASVLDSFTYEVSRREEECVIRRSGSGGRELRFRSLRPARIQVTGGADGAVYRPSRVAARVTGTATGGSFTETRACRAAPIERTVGDCKPRGLTPRRIRAGFRRPGPDALVFRPASSGDVPLCGLDQSYPGGWLHLAPGRVDEDALLNGRSLRVVAGAAATRERMIASTRTVKITQRTTIRWTLTFRRLR
jgi:hypothetical protein